MSKYTPWFDPVTQPPVRVGWYPVMYDDETEAESRSRKRWDGRCWSFHCDDADSDSESALRGKRISAIQSGFKWRGLAAPHHEHKGE